MNADLFQTAYIPRWMEQLDALAQFAVQEPWSYKNPRFQRKNPHTCILEKYILTVFRNQVIDFQSAAEQAEADAALVVRSGYACFHTGLMTRRFKNIYGFLEKNRRPGSYHAWVFKGFFDDTSPFLRNVESLPQKPFLTLRTEQWSFHPEWPIRVNVSHILDEPENLERIPEDLRYYPNLGMLLEVGVETARRMVGFVPSLAVPQLYQGRVQYLLPICLANPEVPDMAMTITPMDGYYIGSTCLNLEIAYSNARLLARPTAPWLMALVE